MRLEQDCWKICLGGDCIGQIKQIPFSTHLTKRNYFHLFITPSVTVKIKRVPLGQWLCGSWLLESQSVPIMVQLRWAPTPLSQHFHLP